MKSHYSLIILFLAAKLSATTASYNANNEIQWYGNTAFSHDANGNMETRTENGLRTTYYWDAENRLVRISRSDGMEARYYYDPFGRRLWKEVNGLKTYFFYSDEGLIAEINSGGKVTKEYGYGGGRNPIWMKITEFSNEPPGLYWFLNDSLDTPQKITSISGEVVWSATYAAFGKASVDPASKITNNIRLPGQYFDEESGLHYNNQRYYDPELGRYISPDLLGVNGSYPNLFTYSNNNPVNIMDPFGLKFIVNPMPTGQIIDIHIPLPPAVWINPPFDPWPLPPGDRIPEMPKPSVGYTPSPAAPRYTPKEPESCPNETGKVESKGDRIRRLANLGRRLIGRPIQVPTNKLYPEPGGDYDKRPGFDEDAVGRRRGEIINGELEPIKVIETPDGYMISDGLHRWEAARRSNMATVPVEIIGKQ